MTVALILHPHGEARPSGLGRAVAAFAAALKAAAPELAFVEYTKRGVGGGPFWLERLGRAPRADTYIFFTPVMPLTWRPRHAIVFAHDLGYFAIAPRTLKERLLRRALIWRHGRALRAADAVVAVSEATKQEVVKRFGIPAEKIHVIYNGVNELPAPEPVEGLPTRFFLYAGVIKERKNVLTLARAFKKYREAGGTSALVIAGKMEGEYAEWVRAELASVAHAVRFLGYVSDAQLTYLFSKAQAFVYPSLVEGFGMTVVEAMAAGLPIITSNEGALKEVAGDAALLVDPRDEAALAEAMGKLLGDTTLHTDLARRARARAARYSWARAGKELASLVQDLKSLPNSLSEQPQASV